MAKCGITVKSSFDLNYEYGIEAKMVKEQHELDGNGTVIKTAVVLELLQQIM